MKKRKQQAPRPVSRPEPVVVLLQQAISLYRQDRHLEAESLFSRVLLADPGNPHALHMLGLIANDRNDLTMAEQLISRAVQLHPHSRVAHNLGVVLQRLAKPDAAITLYRQALAREPDYLEAAANLIFALDMHPQAPSDLLLYERRVFDAMFCAELTDEAAPHTNEPDMGRRLNVGYISGDFRRHSASWSFERSVLGHNPEQFAVHLYSTAEKHDERSEMFKARADVWAEVADLDDDELAQVIRADGIDILVDLSGFTKGHRLLTFARKPAPVQISGWGYALGTGMRAIDYLMADPTAVPPENEWHHDERLLHVPCVLTYAPPDDVPEIQPAPEIRRGHRTFGYLGRPSKISPETFGMWAAILRRDPQSRLLMKAAEYQTREAREWVAHSLLALGVDISQIEVRGATGHAEHLAVYGEVDVALDPHPQGSGMTFCEASVMGVPTVTLLGDRMSSRIGASLLTAMGRTEWIAASREEYIEKALQPLPDRAAVRADLLASAICNVGTSIDDAYREAWHTWCVAQVREVAA